MEDIQIPDQPSRKMPDIEISRFSKISEIHFDVSRVTIELVSINSIPEGLTTKMASDNAFLLEYRKKGGGSRPICLLGFDLKERHIIVTQLQGVVSNKSKAFFYCIDLPVFWKSYIQKYCLDNCYTYSIRIDASGIDQATDGARERIGILLQI